MKLVIFLAVCIFTSNAFIQPSFDEFKKIWQGVLMDYTDDCIEETGADRALAGRVLPYGEYAENKKLKCFVKCVNAKLHMVGEDAEAHNYDFLDKLHIFDPRIRHLVIHKCVRVIKKDDECARAFYTSKCIYFLVRKVLTDKSDKLEL